MPSAHSLSYAQRAEKHENPAARLLLETIIRKESNLAVSVDVTKSEDFLAIIDAVGPLVCLIKTHIDILEDFDYGLIKKLEELSQKHDFVIFEDRKFADIGNTVALQYSSGVHKIASWSHITNAHPVPGPSIITGLASVGLPLGRGLLLLAEMSTKGTLATGGYTEEAVRLARANKKFVIGFIAQRRMDAVGLAHGDNEEDDFLILTPGVGLEVKGDGMGQQYRTPDEVVRQSGCDVIIVGRGVYGADFKNVEAIRARAEKYRQEGWNAYLKRVES
ncbi:orotidine-5'-phosphate decarboxylase [Macrolepiota fuliginosa MF-IS2]|uniref:Orotidine 5'-phosphate decarboxylase n=1 Tax=Macrolepiota fuliginosa MF-IS2 TaxID=1400762 RepID=A0A9P5XIU6_9AGAR|nr:orotidine-5'-phosphate decarboxylase [Macrolepiota fuliginosa MF-IS2]